MGDSPKVRSPHWEPLLGPVIRTGKWVGRARTVELHGMIAKTSGERARLSTVHGGGLRREGADDFRRRSPTDCYSHVSIARVKERDRERSETLWRKR